MDTQDEDGAHAAVPALPTCSPENRRAFNPSRRGQATPAGSTNQSPLKTNGTTSSSASASAVVASASATGPAIGPATGAAVVARPDTHAFAVSGTTFQIDNKYKFIKPIGHGAYGVVISAENLETSEKVAIKKISKAFEDTVDAKRILREIKLLQHFDHENVITIVDLLPPAGIAHFDDVYIVSDLMETDLHRIIYSRQPLTDDHIQYFLYQILRALKYIHSANVLHRDLKPSNLLLNSNCDLKVCDFGLARGVEPDEDNMELTEYVVTRWYRAPEIMLSTKEYTKAIDMWSTGCIFAELLGRKPLFPGDDYIHQLQIICDKLGTPQEAELHFVTSDKARRFMKNQPVRPGVPLDKLFPAARPEAIDLLRKMLVFDPSKRISVEDALAHPYLDSLHNVDDEPTADRNFSFEFEKQELHKRRLQELIFEEILKFHPEAQFADYSLVKQVPDMAAAGGSATEAASTDPKLAQLLSPSSTATEAPK